MSISQQTLGYKDTLFKVSVDLPDVLEIDAKNMVVRVEPSVTIGINIQYFYNAILHHIFCTLKRTSLKSTVLFKIIVYTGGQPETSC